MQEYMVREERLKAQALEDRDIIDKVSRTNQKDLQHSLKILVTILMILTAPDSEV